MAKTYIADKATQDLINQKIGETADTGGTNTTGTADAKLNAVYLGVNGVNSGIDGINSRLDGMVTPYGKGTYGDLIFNSNDFVWPSQDGFNRYIVHTKSLTIPAGQVMKPPAKCDGLYIYSQGDVIINGDIDLRGLRKTFTGDIQLSATINVDDAIYTLAKGGYSPMGGASGAGGSAKESSSSSADLGSPAVTPTKSIAGNVNGGGVGYFGGIVPSAGADSDSNGDWYTISCANNSLPELCRKLAPTALVIIAAGKVTISGNILASANEGVNATAGSVVLSNKSGIERVMSQSQAFYYTVNGVRERRYIPFQNDNNSIYGQYRELYNEFGITSEVTGGAGVRSYYCATFSGAGAIPPSGGGPVTIICKTLVNTGVIDTSGSKLVSPNGADDTNTYRASSSGYPSINGSKGGKGGTFISTAGEIKVYETGGEA